MTSRRLQLVALALLLFACAPESESLAKPEHVPPDEAIARLALKSLPSLRASQLFRDWKASNPGDSITLHGPQFEDHEDDAWCARATKTLKLDSLTVVRSAYFFPPPPDDPLVLPGDQSPEQLAEQCRLEFFVIEFVQADSLLARTHQAEIRRALSVGLGPADDINDVGWWGSAYWRNRSSWRGKDVSVVAAITGARFGSATALAGDSTQVFVLGFGNVFGRIDPREWSPGDLQFDLDEAHQRQGQARLEETISTAALGGEAERQIRAIISREPREFNDAYRDTFATALERWLTDARQLPPPRRAAALLVADQMLSGYEGVLNLGEPDQKALRDRFAAYGAEFDHDPLGGDAYMNTHTWVKEALELDPNGRAGELAFLMLIGWGFDTSATCAEQDQFRTVIARGEQYLRERPASAISKDVHLMVAHAYTDIWTLANGGGYEGAVPELQPEAPAARVRAIAEYRAALSGVSRTPDARESWIDAWRVMAGLTPMRTFFYCVYD